MSKEIKHYKEIVIGSGLNAILYSFFNSVPIIFKKTKRPELFEVFDSRYESKYTKKIENIIDFDKTQREAWTKLVFALNGAGLIISNEYTLSLRIDARNKQLKIVTYKAGINSFSYDKLIIFDDEELQGLPAPSQRIDEYEVIDWFKVRACGPHDLNIIKTKDKFVNKIHFVSFNEGPRPESIASVSYLTTSQLMSFEFSDTMAKFKVQKLMKKNGIKGPRNGKDPKDPKKYKYYSIKIESAYRKTHRKSMNVYDKIEGIEFMYMDPIDVIMNGKLDKDSYQYKLYHMMDGSGRE